MTLKMDFGCDNYVLLKKCINGRQSVTWQVEVGAQWDGWVKQNSLPSLTLPISSLLQISYLWNDPLL
jgi:hypothetical protein